MPCRPALLPLTLLCLLVAAPSLAQPAPKEGETVGRLPHLEVDATQKIVRVECEALRVEVPLEFFLVVSGTSEHESVLRSPVRPSHLHAALLMLGLEPGEPVRFSESLNRWLPPQGPPLHLTVEFEKDGKPVSLPAYRLMRDIRTKKEMPPMTWIFAGSRMMPGDVYAADRLGYLVSVVNFDFTVIDIPKLASNANELLEWEVNHDLMPPRGTKVTLVIQPAGAVQAPATQPAAAGGAGPIDQPLVTIAADGQIGYGPKPVKSPAALIELLRETGDVDRRVRVAVANPVEENPQAREVINALSAARVQFVVIPQASAGTGAPALPGRPPEAMSDVRADEELIRRLRTRWEQSVAPHGASLREAARTHYDVIRQLRLEQQRLIDEADKVHRLIDELERQYQDMTTPRPE